MPRSAIPTVAWWCKLGQWRSVIGLRSIRCRWITGARLRRIFPRRGQQSQRPCQSIGCEPRTLYIEFEFGLKRKVRRRSPLVRHTIPWEAEAIVKRLDQRQRFLSSRHLCAIGVRCAHTAVRHLKLGPDEGTLKQRFIIGNSRLPCSFAVTLVTRLAIHQQGCGLEVGPQSLALCICDPKSDRSIAKLRLWRRRKHRY